MQIGDAKMIKRRHDFQKKLLEAKIENMKAETKLQMDRLENTIKTLNEQHTMMIIAVVAMILLAILELRA